MRRSWTLLLVVLGLLALTLSACGNNENVAGTEKALENPGIYDQTDGSVQVVGVLTYRDLEGGIWVVVDTTKPEEADSADIIAVLGSSEEIAVPTNSYEGKYVSVTGQRRDASTYQAGQFIEVKSIEIVTDVTTE